MLELVAEESRINLKEIDRQGEYGIEAHKVKYKYKSKSKLTCFKCGRRGHVQSQCIPSKNFKKNEKYNLAVTSTNSSSQEILPIKGNVKTVL